ncbi:Cyclin-L1 [Armadillidium nasatum]|uniref:Cyclin-L1 n=1 Tax=Armadillidium nasatum TaxID=96803 RepID=A0A5N5SJE5_9CRUS|nr:Cyclin-L1 [Armadillidium nasatum]
MATGQVLFQRFYYAKSLVRYPMETTAMACVALASKIEEAPMKIRDVINVFNHIKQVKNGKTIQPVILDSNYIALKNQVVKAERRLLKELGFCCHVKHPHKIIIMYLRLLEAEHKKLAQSSWNYMNDALRTDVFVRYSPETIACSCIWLAGRQLKIPLPENPPWYHIFRVTLSDIEEIAASILKLYTRKKTKLEVLETKVEEIRREQQEARLRNKAVSALATPKEVTTFSPVSRNNTPSKSNAASPRQRKRSSSERRKQSGSSNGSSRSKSRSPNRHARKKTKRSHTRSRSISRSRSHSRERYHKKKYSRSPSPAVTPPPRFIKNKEKGPIVRSVSRSRSRSRSPHRMYDKYEKISSKQNDRYDKLDRLDKSDKYVKDDRRYDHKDKYSIKYLKLDKKSKREMKKYYDNGYEKHHKSKKNGRTRSRSRERENRRR